MDVVVVVGAGLIGQAIARRVGPGRKIVLADLRRENADAAVEVFLNAGFDAEAATVDAASRESVQALATLAAGMGDVKAVIHAPGSRPRRLRWRSSCASTSTAPLWCWRSSAG